MKNKTLIAIACTLGMCCWAAGSQAETNTSTPSSPTLNSAANANTSENLQLAWWAGPRYYRYGNWCDRHPAACRERWCANNPRACGGSWCDRHPVACRERWCANHPRQCRGGWYRYSW